MKVDLTNYYLIALVAVAVISFYPLTNSALAQIQADLKNREAPNP